jgi:uncharacterized protein YceH (UPF0502 family)
MLRGPQTPGELKTRTDRLHGFGDMSDLMETIERLVSRDLAVRLDRRPGQREERYRHRLSEELVEEAPEPEPIREEVVAQDDERIQRIERQLAELRSEIQALREELGA